MTVTTKTETAKAPNPNQLKTDTLKEVAMAIASGAESRHSYTEVVKVLARRLKASPKKVRRQARTQFWSH